MSWINQTDNCGSGCSKAVEHAPHDIGVVGSNPARSWAFFSSLSYQQFVLNQVEHS